MDHSVLHTKLWSSCWGVNFVSCWWIMWPRKFKRNYFVLQVLAARLRLIIRLAIPCCSHQTTQLLLREQFCNFLMNYEDKGNWKNIFFRLAFFWPQISKYKFDLHLTVHHQCRYNNIEKPTRCNSNNLFISNISSTCFGQLFAHLQERKTEIYSMWYSVLVL